MLVSCLSFPVPVLLCLPPNIGICAVCFNYGVRAVDVRVVFKEEYELHATLLPHRNVLRFLRQFEERQTELILQYLPEVVHKVSDSCGLLGLWDGSTMASRPFR